jgi:hypothetical protein
MITLINFMIHTPINSRGYLMEYIKRNLPEMEKSIGDKVSISTPGNDHSKSWLLESIAENNLPDVILAHASDFSVLKDRKEGNLFSSIAGKYAKENTIREELEVLIDPYEIFYPLFVVPMVMCYNTRIVNKEDLKNSWTDIFNEKLNVIFPDKDTPSSKAVRAYLKKNYPREYEAFEKKVTYGHSPVEVIQAVAAGQYHMGISNVSFPMMAKQKDISINMPVEGVVPLPQVLLWKKNISEKLTKIADLLMQEEIQNYLGEQGFWPVRKNAPIGSTTSNSELLKSWDGWNIFIKSISDLETETKGE